MDGAWGGADAAGAPEGRVTPQPVRRTGGPPACDAEADQRCWRGAYGRAGGGRRRAGGRGRGQALRDRGKRAPRAMGHGREWGLQEVCAVDGGA